MILKKILIFLSIACLFFSVAVCPAMAGFGVSPTILENQYLLPGNHFEQIIYLVRNDNDNIENLKIEIELIAPDFEDWIKIDQEKEFLIPSGVSQFPLKFTIDVPSEAKLGSYNGKIKIKTSSEKNNNSLSPINTVLGAEVEIKLKVIDTNYSSFSIQYIVVPDFKGGSPLKLIAKINNKGNIELELGRLQLDVFRDSFKALLQSFENSEKVKVPPFTISEITKEFNNDLKTGEYWCEAKVYEGGKLAKNEKMIFNVLGDGVATENNSTIKKKIKTELNPAPPLFKNKAIIITISVVLIIIIAYLAVIIFKNFDFNSNKKTKRKK